MHSMRRTLSGTTDREIWRGRSGVRPPPLCIQHLFTMPAHIPFRFKTHQEDSSAVMEGLPPWMECTLLTPLFESRTDLVIGMC